MAYSYIFGNDNICLTYQLGSNVWCDVHTPIMWRDRYDDVTGDVRSSMAQSNVWYIDRIYGSGPMHESYLDIPDAETYYTLHDGTTAKISSYWRGPVLRNSNSAIYIEDGITTIAQGCFQGLNDMSSDYETYIDEYYDFGFNTTRVVRNPSVAIGASVVKIGVGAFQPQHTSTEYSMLASVTVRGNVQEIGRAAFQNQQLLTGIDFHHSPTIVDGAAFQNCYNLEYVNISDDWTGLDYVGPSYNTFENCYKLSRISPKNKIKNIRGTMYRNCNMLTQVTIEDDDFGNYQKQNALYVDLFAGDPDSLDEEGYLITEVNENSVINPYVLAYNWKDNWHRIIAYYSDEFVHLYHMGKHIQIRCYTKGALPLKHDDIWYFLKWVKLQGDEALHSQTPLFVAHNGHWYQVCY